MDVAQLAQDHWNETPLFLTEQERYSMAPWFGWYLVVKDQKPQANID